ncbi:hypothetical protein [Roseibium sp. SCP14]|uniref:hypothetical protein n=1 Tax=Roseibium sp. SCP14 TaxID=3141375 RepID=UPI00333C2E13
MMFSRAPGFAAGLTAAVSLIALQTSPALAFDPSGNEIADAFLTLLDSEEGTVESYGSVDASGNTVTISDLLITNEDEKDAKVTIASTVLTGGDIQANGRLKLENLTLEKLELAAEDGGMTLETVSVSALVLPSADEAKSKDTPIGPGYESFEASSIQIRDEDGKVADIEKVSSSIDSMDGDLPTSGQFSITGAMIDVKQIEAEEARSLTDLGYETLSIDVSGSGKWDPDAATVEVPGLNINAKDAASLTISFSLGGVTRDVVTGLNEASDNSEETMALLQNITIANAKVRLDDESLTGRILDQEAQKAGVEVPVYVSQLTGALPVMLGVLQNKELEAQVNEAVTEFLTTPGSLEIAASPAAPVPVAQIMGTVMFAPQMIPQILSVGITANQ